MNKHTKNTRISSHMSLAEYAYLSNNAVHNSTTLSRHLSIILSHYCGISRRRGEVYTTTDRIYAQQRITLGDKGERTVAAKVTEQDDILLRSMARYYGVSLGKWVRVVINEFMHDDVLNC